MVDTFSHRDGSRESRPVCRCENAAEAAGERRLCQQDGPSCPHVVPVMSPSPQSAPKAAPISVIARGNGGFMVDLGGICVVLDSLGLSDLIAKGAKALATPHHAAHLSKGG